METKNLSIYDTAPIPWSRARDAMAAARGPGATFFLGTVSPDATPHAAGLGAVWAEDTMWFVTGPRTRKARNLAGNPACTLSCRLPGIDVVLEGRAERVTDTDTLTRLGALYRQIGWPAEVEGDAFTAPYSAPSAGPPPWHLYRFTIHTAFGVATDEPYGASRWRFTS
jgi:Pyridoxamine 5'-phosphate oxidase